MKSSIRLISAAMILVVLLSIVPTTLMAVWHKDNQLFLKIFATELIVLFVLVFIVKSTE